MDAIFRAFAESASDAVVLCDTDGLITFANLSAERLFGCAATDGTLFALRGCGCSLEPTQGNNREPVNKEIEE